ncbi:MAG: uridine kinase, partial [Cytophagales bacterium]
MSKTITPFIIGITGASGSGKTTFMNQLTQSFHPDEITLISMDNYYKSKQLQPRDENGVENYDTLESIDIIAFLEDINKLCSGVKFEKLEYDFNNPNFKPKNLVFKPTPVLVLEGLFLFSYSEVFDLIDLKIFIEAEDHHRITRRLERDLNERGYTVEQTIYWITKHVEPAFKNFVLPYKNQADFIIPNNHNFTNALKVIVGFLRSR